MTAMGLSRPISVHAWTRPAPRSEPVLIMAAGLRARNVALATTWIASAANAPP
jgi:hypothetical protein